MAPFGPSDKVTGSGQAGREFGPHATPATPAQANKITGDKETVTMVFPRPVTLTTDSYKRIHFPAGINEVPVSLANHEYLAQNGVSRHNQQVSKLPDPDTDEDEDEDDGRRGQEFTVEALSKLTKADLIHGAKEDFGLELDPVKKKDDLILDILAEVEKRKALDAAGAGQK